MEGELVYKFPAENGGEIERRFFFGNYALEQTLEELNASVSDISELLNKKLLPFLRKSIYHAACYPVLDAGGHPDFTEFDVHKWIDQTGGTNGEFMQAVSKKVFGSLGIGDEKKTEVQPKKVKK